MNYTKLDLPKIPKELILPIKEVLQLENIFGGRSKNYTIHECQPELSKYLKELFPECTKFRYQTLTKDVPIHTDRGRDFAINYIIETGGPDAETCWYEDYMQQPIDTVVLPKEEWYKLTVDIHHTVRNITDWRFAVTVN